MGSLKIYCPRSIKVRSNELWKYMKYKKEEYKRGYKMIKKILESDFIILKLTLNLRQFWTRFISCNLEMKFYQIKAKKLSSKKCMRNQ